MYEIRTVTYQTGQAVYQVITKMTGTVISRHMSFAQAFAAYEILEKENRRPSIPSISENMQQGHEEAVRLDNAAVQHEIEETLAEIPLDEEELERLFGKKYYYKTKGQEPDVNCIELCQVMAKEFGTKNGLKIGSASCTTDCPYCIAEDSDERWIICKEIKRATAKN